MCCIVFDCVQDVHKYHTTCRSSSHKKLRRMDVKTISPNCYSKVEGLFLKYVCNKAWPLNTEKRDQKRVSFKDYLKSRLLYIIFVT
jgi:hypothetical protein